MARAGHSLIDAETSIASPSSRQHGSAQAQQHQHQGLWLWHRSLLCFVNFLDSGLAEATTEHGASSIADIATAANHAPAARTLA